MTGRARAVVWVGVALAVSGAAVALVAWVGLDRANQEIGVPAAVAAVLGLAVSVYGVFAPDPASPQGVLVENSKIGRSSVVIGRARSIRIGEATSVPGPAASGQPDSIGSSVPVVVRGMKIKGNSTVIGEADGDVEIRDGA